MARRILPWLLAGLPFVALVVLALMEGLPAEQRSAAGILRFPLPQAGHPVDLPEISGPRDRSRPLVLIDAGHGGHDPGAVGAGIAEKDIVLALARSLRDELIAQGGIRVAMTRKGDSFLALDERFQLARRLGADLFVSIHADSAGERVQVSGASIYTLSGEASSEAAARFAERENEADVVNGVALTGRSDTVSAILVDLSQRRVLAEASEFADLVLREGQSTLVFHPQARRSASLVVLRAPDVPSVLYEAGFVTNHEDAERLISEEGRQNFAEVMARAIRIHFARQRNA